MCSKETLNFLILKIAGYSKILFGDRFVNVILYGSYARGDYDNESDIDVIVMVDMSPDELCEYRWDMDCFCADLNVENNVFITAKLQSKPLFDKWKDTLPFYRNVQREGIVYA